MDYNQQLDTFLTNSFPDLQLKSPLFYNASIGLRFELGGEIKVPKLRAEQVKHRAITLFNALNHKDDSIYLVVFMDSWDEHPVTTFENDIYELFRNYASEITLYNVFKQEQEFRYKDPDELDETVTIRYCTKVKVQDLKVENLLSAIANRSMGLKPSVTGDIFLINEINNTIFYLYDDRGMDIVSEKVETLRKVYGQYNNWILDYDRNRINEMFSKRNLAEGS